ncbi:MAG: serine hydrolase [Bacteroidales bacterium]|nr:serine hydrolase [Bacteroidales bacterium]
MKRLSLITLLLFCPLLMRAVSPVSGLQKVSPACEGMDSLKLERIDSVMNGALSSGLVPGAVVCVVRNGSIVYSKAFGYRALVPSRERMTEDTVFDLASLSKVTGTTMAVMQLIERGKLRLNDNVSRYIPGYLPWISEKGDKVEIKVRDLLTHSSGLPAYIFTKTYFNDHSEHDPPALVRWISSEAPRDSRPGSRYKYSCLNFITLQAIVEKLTGERLCDYLQKNVYEPLGMRNTCYYPKGTKISPEVLANIAPTEVQPDGKPLRGQVHDPIARRIMDGNSGNAGVFSNAADLAVLCAALLNMGEWEGTRVLSPLSVMTMFAIPAENNSSVGRALGWDCYSSKNSIGNRAGSRGVTFSHTGFTGTSIALNLEENTAVIILSNRVHPRSKGNLADLRNAVSMVVSSSFLAE